MLYIKNNKLHYLNIIYLNIIFILLIYIYFFTNNNFAFAVNDKQNHMLDIVNEQDKYSDQGQNKYQILEVKFNIVVAPEYKINVKELTKLTKSIQEDLLINKAVSEQKLTINRIQNLHNRALEEIIQNLQSFGYYEIKVIENDLLNTDKHWLATYKVEIKSPVKIKNIKINILGIISKNKQKLLIRQVNKYLKINSNLIHENYEKAKQVILNNLHEDGFLNAKIKESKVLVDLQSNIANILITVDVKQQYYLGKTIFKSKTYSQDFLNKYLPFKENDLYSMDSLMQLKNNLLNSDLFSKVRIDTIDINDLSDNVVPVVVRVYNKPKHKYFGSLGFGTDTGFRGSLGYVYRLPNLPGSIMNINLSASKKRKQAFFDYGFLGKNPITQKYNFGLILQKEKIKNRRNKNIELYLQKSIKKNDFTQVYKLSFLKEYSRELPSSTKQNTTLLIPSLKFTWIHLDDVHIINSNVIDNQEEDNNEKIQNVKFGNKLNLITKFGINSRISSANLFQLILNEKLIKPFIYDTKIIFKVTLGTTIIKDFKYLPLSLRFFTGGDHSIRGFGYNSLGPISKDLDNNVGVIGGKHLLFSSIELEKPIPQYSQLAVAFFVDAGNSVNNFYKFISTKLAVSTGVGISYSTQIGSLKLYLAKPIKQPKFLEFSYTKHVRIHLNFVTDL